MVIATTGFCRKRPFFIQGRILIRINSKWCHSYIKGAIKGGRVGRAKPMVGKMNKGSNSLIVFAWGMEIVGVTSGVVNSAYTTFGDNLPSSASGYIPVVPIVALAVAELGRVPLASVLYHKHRAVQGIALIGILALGYLAIENWTFGFERVVDLRLGPVTAATAELRRAEASLASLTAQRDRTTSSGERGRGELSKTTVQIEESIARHTAQLVQEAKSHQENLSQIREACRVIRDKCMVPRSVKEDERYAAEVERLNAELARERAERSKMQMQLRQRSIADAAELAAIEGQIASAAASERDHRQSLYMVANGNQIYRLAASWYRVNVTDVSPEQFATARLVFATFSAIAVALAGTVAALVYYARNRTAADTPTFEALMRPLVRARRAYYARKRKSVVREIPGPERVIYRDGASPPIVIEKEVPRFVDRIVLIPRFGIRFPVYLNRLFGNDARADEPQPAPANVSAFARRGA